VALLMLVIGAFPSWWPFLVASYKVNHPHYELIVVHTGPPPRVASGDGHIRYEFVTREALAERFSSKLGAGTARVQAKFASAKGLSDLKPFYGKVFEDFLLSPSRAAARADAVGRPHGEPYTHWGWVDWDLLLGDVRAVVPDEELWRYDAVTFAGATLGFAWAGQVTIMHNVARTRELYKAVRLHLQQGFKSDGDGQSGWEERLFLKETLEKETNLSISFNMAAQFDHKAQWLTWVPFDHFWEDGKIWRCARQPLQVKGRPPYNVPDRAQWLEDVALIQREPQEYFDRKNRVCIRWDLLSSPWMCCPHSIGVSYGWYGGALHPYQTAPTNGSSELRSRLAARARNAGVAMRMTSYDTCMEGAFFHAGLKPVGPKIEPTCSSGAWALLDDIGRFSGKIQLLHEQCP